MHHYLLFCRLRGEFEEIAEKAVTTPTNTEELMELKAYMEKVESETMYALERKLIEARTTLAFLLEYTSLSPLEMLCNTNAFAWHERMHEVLVEHRAIVAEKQTQFQDAMKVQIVHFVCNKYQIKTVSTQIRCLF